MALVLQHPAIQAQQGLQKKTDMPVAESSFIQHVSYDAPSLQMTITLKTGAQYIYFMVYPATMDQFMQSRSKGEFYTKQIRGKHQSSRTISKNVGKKVQTQHKT